MLWVYVHYKYFTLSMQGSTSIDVGIYRRQNLTSEVGPGAEKIICNWEFNYFIANISITQQ